MQDIVGKAQDLLSRATAGGTAAAEVLLRSEDVRERVSGRKGAAATTTTTRLKVFVRAYDGDGRVGSAFASARTEGEALGVVDAALQRIARSEPDPFAGPADRYDTATRGMGIDDPRRPAVDDEARAESLEMNEEGLHGVPGVVAEPFVYEERLIRRVFQSTRGVTLTETSTAYRMTGSVRLRAEPDVVLRSEVFSRHFADVASVPLGAVLARRAQAVSRRAEPLSGTPVVVFEPRVVARLVTAITPAFDAELVERGRSLLSRLDKQQIGSPRFHLVDDASLAGGPNTRAFDDRGVPPMPLPLVREGVASAMYKSPEQARAGDVRPTGHVSADLGIWPGNLVIRPGSRTRNMLFPDLGRFYLVDDLLDTEGIDLATGRLALPCRVLVADASGTHGTIGVRTLETTAAALFGGLADLASDQERHGAVDACTWILEGLTIG